MSWRLSEFRAKIQFIAPPAWPSRIYAACVQTATVSNTRYIQEAVAERLSRDLCIPLDELIAELPKPWGPAGVVLGPDRKPVPRATRPNNEVI